MLRAGLLHPDDQDAYYADIRRLLRGEIDRIDRDRRLIRADGEVVWVSGGTTLLREDGEQILHSVMQDITDRKLAEEALTESENRFRTLTESIPAGVYQADGTGARHLRQPPVVRDHADIGGADDPEEAMAPVHPDDYDRVGEGPARRCSRRRRLPGPVPHHRLARLRALDPQPGRGHHRRAAARSPGIIGSVEDVTELVVAQEQNSRLAEIVESTSDLVGMTDGQTGKLIYLNRSARETFGFVDRDILHVPGASLYTAEGLPVYQSEILPRLSQGERWTGELPMFAADGGEILVWQVMTPTMRADGTLHQLSTVGRDVTERKRFETDLAHQATHDPLTGLPNRALLLDHLELELARAERERPPRRRCSSSTSTGSSRSTTRLGHDAGDELLAQAAQRHLGGRATGRHRGPHGRRRVRHPVRRRRGPGPRHVPSPTAWRPPSSPARSTSAAPT